MSSLLAVGHQVLSIKAGTATVRMIAYASTPVSYMLLHRDAIARCRNISSGCRDRHQARVRSASSTRTRISS